MTDGSSTDIPASWANDDDPPRRGLPGWAWTAGGMLAVVAVIAVVAVVVLNTNEEREWPASVGGRPPGLGEVNETAAEVTPTASPGIYVWNSFDGWHVWVVNGEGVNGVSGTITSTDGVAKAVLSAPGVGSVSSTDDEATFDLPGDAPLAGVDFDPGFYAEELTVTLEGPDGPIDPAIITLGTDTPADANPVVIDKPVVS